MTTVPTLSPPIVIGPLSILNGYVIVENHEPGTALKIYADNTLIGTKQNAAGGRDQVNLNTDLRGFEGATIRATQEDPLNAESVSPLLLTPDPVTVLSVLDPLPYGQFDGTIYQCTTHIRIFGLTPGADFTVEQPLGNVLLTGQTYDGWAEGDLSQPIVGSSSLYLIQTATPSLSEPPLKSTSQYPVPIPQVPLLSATKLQQLSIVDAPDCGWPVTIAGATNDVMVTVTRKRLGSSDLTGSGYGGSDGSCVVWMSEKINAGDKVSAIQSIFCENATGDPPQDDYNVSMRTPQAPTILPPVCLNTGKIYLSGMEPDADYKVVFNYETKTAGGTNKMTVAIGSGHFAPKYPKSSVSINPIALPTDVVADRSTIQIQQTVCGKWSDLSVEVPVNTKIIIGPPGRGPTLPEELYACAMYVRVENVTPGSWVSVHSLQEGGQVGRIPPSGEIGFTRSEGTVALVPLRRELAENDTVWAFATDCTSVGDISKTKIVHKWSKPLKPNIDRIGPSDTKLHVRDLVTGARVFTQIEGPSRPSYRNVYNTSFAMGAEMDINVGTMSDDDVVTICQFLCPDSSKSNEVSVTPGSCIDWSPIKVSCDITYSGNGYPTGVYVTVQGVGVQPFSEVTIKPHYVGGCFPIKGHLDKYITRAENTGITSKQNIYLTFNNDLCDPRCGVWYEINYVDVGGNTQSCSTKGRICRC